MEQPTWYDDGVKALSWLEAQRQRNNIFFYPFAVAAGSRVSLATVELMMSHAGKWIQRRGKQIRYNAEYAALFEQLANKQANEVVQAHSPATDD